MGTKNTSDGTERRSARAITSLRTLAGIARAVAVLVAVVAAANLLGSSTMERPVGSLTTLATTQGTCSADVTQVELRSEWAAEPSVRSFENVPGAGQLTDAQGRTVCQQLEAGVTQVRLSVETSLWFRLTTGAVWAVWCAWVVLVATALGKFLDRLAEGDLFADADAQVRLLQRTALAMTAAVGLWVANYLAGFVGLPVASVWLAGCGLVGGYLLYVMAAMVRRGGELRDETEATV